ncbi:TetR/AcrR family transcriptional regulator [Subtercola boreus]|uniref:TetR family transcriptional regulator n=1 Tax=Subtercola boreus TaxID=120213 RepID=A0A3E0W6R0_9MICO|nr:TetR/AcrR family transcriptional regulator [Subtercola boreus]RFA18223.1 TetR family transcriptional regulator [Subtercola boreus]RFA18615.1 TetR family transcriptional regulator [Subtercola boreus]RFA25219.1 TetR family transcriptional regulator [Subtercola boreus]
MPTTREDLPKANRGPSAGPANREALIAAARHVFAEHGLSAPLSAVARRAGVGQGSLYRHFPDRVSLALAVFDENIADLDSLVSDPDGSVVDLFDRIADQAMASTALIDLITSQRHDDRAVGLGRRLENIIDTVLERDQKRDRIARTVVSADILLSISMLAFLLARTDADQQPGVAARARAIFRAAFRPAG